MLTRLKPRGSAAMPISDFRADLAVGAITLHA